MAASASDDIQRLIENIEKVIIGKRETILLTISALLSGGHVLLEDKPGLGKTMMARALAQSISCEFKRIQCTPDLLPVDITGYVDPRKEQFVPGSIFANIVLADELNRAMPRTQSALLEAMGEGQVTVERVTHILPKPFMVIATQNPIEHRGVNDLPEAQLDRFQMLIAPGYPTEEEEMRILLDRFSSDPIESLEPVLDAARVGELIQAASEVRVHEKLIMYILAMTRATRQTEQLAMGASPRSALQLMHLSKAYALTEGRTYVIPDDIKQLAHSCIPHRVIPTVAVSSDGKFSGSAWKTRIVDELIQQVPSPGL